MRITNATASNSPSDFLTINVNAQAGKNPNFIMVDSGGNLIVSISDGDYIWVWPNRGDSNSPYPLAPNNGYSTVYTGFAMDAAGTIWVDDYTDQQVFQLPGPYPSAPNNVTIFDLHSITPWAVAVDSTGLYVGASNGTTSVIEHINITTGGLYAAGTADIVTITPQYGYAFQSREATLTTTGNFATLGAAGSVFYYAMDSELAGNCTSVRTISSTQIACTVGTNIGNGVAVFFEARDSDGLVQFLSTAGASFTGVSPALLTIQSPPARLLEWLQGLRFRCWSLRMVRRQI